MATTLDNVILELPPAAGNGARLCPKCNNEIKGKFCAKCHERSIYESSALNLYGKLRVEDGLPFFGGFFENSVYGYDLRFLTTKIKNLAAEASRYYQAYIEVTNPKTVIFSRDQRNSGKLLSKSFVDTVKEMGIEFIEIDGFMSTTSAPFFGAMVAKERNHKILSIHSTASHNPPDYNGFKIFHGKFNWDIFPKTLELDKKISSEKIHKAYAEFLIKRFGNRKPSTLKFDIDFMYGVGWEVLQHVLPKIAPRATPIRSEARADLGGLKIAQPPEEHIGHKGLSFCADGDIDRIAMYYNGKYIPMSKFYAILIAHGKFNDRLLVDQRTSIQIQDFMREQGATVIQGKIGRTTQEYLGNKEDALWMEENWHSGGYKSGPIRLVWPEASLGLMDWLNALEEIGVEKFFSTKVPESFLKSKKLQCPPNMNERFWQFAAAHFKNEKVTRIDAEDGVRVEFTDGHLLLRESNTECGSVRVEANGKSEQIATKLLNKGLELTRKLSKN